MPLTPVTAMPPRASAYGGRFDNSYARLPQRLYARLTPTPVRCPRLVQLNVALAEALGLEATWLASAEGTRSGRESRPRVGRPAGDGLCRASVWPLVPQLGDGRAILLGEIVGRDGTRRDLQLKGAGRTPFHAAAMGGPPSAPCSANTFSARRCMPWAFRRRARWRWSPRGSQSSGRRFSPGPCSPAWRPATYASAL